MTNKVAAELSETSPGLNLVYRAIPTRERRWKYIHHSLFHLLHCACQVGFLCQRVNGANELRRQWRWRWRWRRPTYRQHRRVIKPHHGAIGRDWSCCCCCCSSSPTLFSRPPHSPSPRLLCPGCQDHELTTALLHICHAHSDAPFLCLQFHLSSRLSLTLPAQTALIPPQAFLPLPFQQHGLLIDSFLSVRLSFTLVPAPLLKTYPPSQPSLSSTYTILQWTLDR